MNEHVYGLCPECQSVIRRRKPAEWTVCEHCSNADPKNVVRVELMEYEELAQRIGKEVLEQLEREMENEKG